MRLSLWFLCLVAPLVAAQGKRNLELESCVAKAFGNNAAQRMVAPDDATYTDARIGESIQFEQFPTLLAYAEKTSDVASLLACAKKTGVQAVPRNGGHHFVAWSALTDSLVIDLSHIDRVEVSPDKSTAVVGGGIRLGALYTALNLHGRDFNGGSCPTVGLSGFLGAGGFNMQMRQLGMAADSVLAAKVVLADGSTVTASPLENHDLFWAVRGGGGGTFGVVVEWTLRLHAFPRSAMALLRWEDAATRVDAAEAYFAWAPDTDPAFTSQINVYKNRSELVGWCLGCDAAHLHSLFEDSGLLDIGRPEVHISDGCNTNAARLIGFGADACLPDEQADPLASSGMNYAPEPFAPVGNYTQFAYDEQTQDPSSGVATPYARMVRISKSYFLQKGRRASRETLRAAIDKLTELPDEARGWGEWHAWNIKAGGDSAFAWADEAYGHLEFIVTGSLDEDVQQGYRQWEDEMEEILRPRVGPASYTGYIDSRISTDPLESYFGDNVARLSQIKRQYDPDNFFRNPFTITPDGGSTKAAKLRK